MRSTFTLVCAVALVIGFEVEARAGDISRDSQAITCAIIVAALLIMAELAERRSASQEP